MTLFALQVGSILVMAFLAGCLAGCWSSGVTGRARARMRDRLDQLAESAPGASEAGSCATRIAVTGAHVIMTGGEGVAIADDLKLLPGVGPKLEKKLHALGVTRFAQVAAWEKVDVDRIDAELRFRGRIEREGWVAHAKLLLEGEMIEPTPVPAGKSAQPRRSAGK